MSPEEPATPQRPSKSLFLPSPLKPRHNIPNCPQPSILPPHTSTPPGFCRAVGRPTSNQHPPCSSASSSQGHVLSASPVILLGKLCEATGVGQPLYEMYYSHAGPDGFINFTYRVCIPGVSAPFKGLVAVLLGSSTATMLEEAQQAAAQQVLQTVYNSQCAHWQVVRWTGGLVLPQVQLQVCQRYVKKQPKLGVVCWFLHVIITLVVVVVHLFKFVWFLLCMFYWVTVGLVPHFNKWDLKRTWWCCFVYNTF